MCEAYRVYRVDSLFLSGEKTRLMENAFSSTYLYVILLFLIPLSLPCTNLNGEVRSSCLPSSAIQRIGNTIPHVASLTLTTTWGTINISSGGNATVCSDTGDNVALNRYRHGDCNIHEGWWNSECARREITVRETKQWYGVIYSVISKLRAAFANNRN